MKWKPLFAVLLGLLMVGIAMAETSRPMIKPTESNNTLDIKLPPASLGKTMYFYGGDAVKALTELEHNNMTLRIVLNYELSRITFLGVYENPDGRVYYYIVEGPAKKEAALRDFIKNARHFSQRPTFREASMLGRTRNWTDIGAITWKKASIGTTMEMGVTAEFSYVSTTSGMMYYLVEIYQVAKPKRHDIAVDEMVVDVSVPAEIPLSKIWISKWLPQMDGGPKRYYSYTSQISVDGNTLGYSASASTSEDTNDGITFRWKVKSREIGRDVEFIHYDFVKKIRNGRLSRPAYGMILDANPSVILVSTQNNARLSFEAQAKFNIANRMIVPTDALKFEVEVNPDGVRER
ncbi:hypothetical protein, conserved [Thermococcus kodakarensis KOD1]|uniref:Uncharacterized protein n=1 Tax=Thermococcus kodakarensis (strain ATCC BAA-918 / JCM 12380 / KOD1) TaxID=69014 RepID=Q5JH44_THEKO|nr:hypothetical protein [Thermococcus kodakarensis]WCN27423.1 hypothetical protein POG15_07390 [Thermococcus kodakarensis]WCN29713.1 hypothetical protein POG21_07385 [Thermococcus kodakarensis]BAD85642.1 hypothetical protein, conserved [Thermococcus kodakarensis KOD1]